MTPFESARMKALKLLALSMRGEGGEARNARRALEAHCAKHHLDLATLSAEVRQPRVLPIVVKASDWKPKQDLDLAYLAVQCLRYVCGTDAMKSDDVYVAPYTLTQRAKGKRKPAGVYHMVATVTLSEWEDWRSCMDHYAPLFWQMQKDLLKKQKAIRAALKKALHVFANEHNLFPPDAGTNDAPATREQMAAYHAAASAVSGDAWQRPAARLEQPNFMLQ